jgi:large subunit ribosomal protein L25
MKSVAMSAAPRTAIRRGPVNQLRKAGKVPAVIYGRQTQPQALELGGKELETVLTHSATENILVDLAIPGDQRPKRLALVQEVQHHPLSGKVLHVDFHEVAETEKVTVTIPVESTGEPVGVKVSGGVLEHVLFKIKVRALPKDLPEVLVVDVSSLDLGHAIHIGEIVPPAGVEVLGDPKRVVLAVAAPKTEEEAAAEEAAATAAAGPAEPEVIKEKKEEAPAEGAAEAKGEKKAEKKPEKK